LRAVGGAGITHPGGSRKGGAAPFGRRSAIRWVRFEGGGASSPLPQRRDILVLGRRKVLTGLAAGCVWRTAEGFGRKPPEAAKVAQSD